MPQFEEYLFAVIEENDADKLKKLLALNQRYNPRAHNQQGQSFLYRAIVLGHSACAQVLLDHNVPLIWGTRGGQTLLHDAILSHNQELFDTAVNILQQHLSRREWQLLLQHQEQPSHYTPIELAVGEGQEQMAQFLLDNGADIFTITASGLNLLTLAIQQEKPRMLRLLLKQGLSCAAPNREGQLPLGYALAQLAEAEHADRAPSATLIRSINILLRWGAAVDYPPELLASLPPAINGPLNNQQLLKWVKTLRPTDSKSCAIFIAVKIARFGSRKQQKNDFIRLENFLNDQMPGYLLPYFPLITTHNNAALKFYLQRLQHVQQELTLNAQSRTLGPSWWAQPTRLRLGLGVTPLERAMGWGLLLMGTLESIASHRINYADCHTKLLIPAHRQALENLVLEGKQLLEPAAIQPLEHHLQHPKSSKIRDVIAALTELQEVLGKRVTPSTRITNQQFKTLMHAFVNTQTPPLELPAPTALPLASTAAGFFTNREWKPSVEDSPTRSAGVGLGFFEAAYPAQAPQLQPSKEEKKDDFFSGPSSEC